MTPQHTARTETQEPHNNTGQLYNPPIAQVVERNIETLIELRRKEESGRSFQDRMADMMTNFTGSMAFVYLHFVWFAVWIAANQGWLPVKRFDPFPFGLLTMIVSLEAIFLSTFVLVSQNRMGQVADRRADLDLQINLLAEHEITRILTLVDAIAHRLKVSEADQLDVEELKTDITPDIVLDEMQRKVDEQRMPHLP